MSKITSRVSYWVRKHAETRGIALSHLADHAGIGRTTMWALLNVNNKGASDPRLSTVNALAEYLDLDITDLLKKVPSQE